VDSKRTIVMIKDNVRSILSELPDSVELVVAAKTRAPDEIMEAVESGVKIIGENYVQEAERAYARVGNKAEWHFIGHLQRNKVKKTEIDKRCSQIGKVMPVLIEINSGKEEQKSGVLPEDAEQLIREIAGLQHIKVMGLMTMGPRFGNPEDSRHYFVETGGIFDRIRKLGLPDVEMRYLSMGMTNSYKIALEEGANIVRIGTKIFGERDYGEK